MKKLCRTNHTHFWGIFRIFWFFFILGGLPLALSWQVTQFLPVFASAWVAHSRSYNPLTFTLQSRVRIACGYIFSEPPPAFSPSPTCPIPHPPCSYFMPFIPFILLFSYVSFFSFFCLYHFTLPCVYFLPARVVLATFFSHPSSAWFSLILHGNFAFLFHSNLLSTTPVSPTAPV